MEESLRSVVSGLAHELIDRVRAREPLAAVEGRMVDALASVPECGSIVSGYHHRSDPLGRNVVRVVGKGQYTAVMNVVDGEENYVRGTRAYGCSLSFTRPDSGEHCAVVYDGLNEEVLEFVSNGQSDVIAHQFTKSHLIPPAIEARPQRLVLAIGRLFPLDVPTLSEVKDASIRSLGSTTVTVLEILRGHVDIYVNVTKVWNVWWALWLPNSWQLSFDDLSDGQPVQNSLLLQFNDPTKSLALACFRDPAVKSRLTRTLQSFLRYADEKIDA